MIKSNACHNCGGPKTKERREEKRESYPVGSMLCMIQAAV